MEIVLSCNYKDAEQLQVLLVFITFEVTRMPNYESITLREDLHIRKIYSIHYFEYMKDYVFDGESHDFWEFVFVDSGNLFVTAGDKEVLLASNEMIFHKPNEFHALRGDGETSPNLVVVSFECTNPCMKFFENCRVSLNQNERFYLGQIISETRKTFYTPLNNPNICLLERNSVHDFGSEQIIFLSLELLLISLQRRYSTPPAIDPVSSPPFSDHPMIRRDTDEVFQEIIQYLQRNLSEHLTVVQICKENSVGRSQLQKMFHEKTGCGVIDYFCRLKIETAQKMIRQKRYNYTQISDMLHSIWQYYHAPNYRHIQLALDYIAENFSDPNLSLESVSSHIGINATYLSRTFKSILGQNFLYYVNNQWITNAKKLLLSSDLPIQEIGTLVGYTNMTTFFRVFKKYTDTTPRVFRQDNRGEAPR